MHGGGPDRKLGALAARELSPFDATMLVMGGIVGVGIFFNPAQVAALVPEPRLFLALWALGGAVALCGALTFAELGAAFPREGGWYVFLREAFGPFTAFLFAWVVLSVISTAAVAVMVGFLTDTLRTLVPAIGPQGGAATIAVGAGVVVGLTALSIAGAKVGATFQNACMLLKLGAIGAIVAGSFTVLRIGPLDAPPLPVREPAELARGAVRAILPVLFTCGGWQMLCYVAPLVRDPRRTLPRAIVAGVVGVVVVYVAANGAYLRTLGIEGLAGDPAFASRVADATLGPSGSVLLRWAMVVSALGVCTVTVVATPWMYVAMAREGLFFSRFAELSPRTGAPVLALCVQCALCLAYWLWAQSGSGAVTPDVLVNSVAFVEWIFHVLVAWACLRLRATRADVPRPFRAATFAPVLYLAFAVAVVASNLATGNSRDTAIGLSLVAAGAAVYLPWRRLVAARPA